MVLLFVNNNIDGHIDTAALIYILTSYLFGKKI